MFFCLLLHQYRIRIRQGHAGGHRAPEKSQKQTAHSVQNVIASVWFRFISKYLSPWEAVCWKIRHYFELKKDFLVFCKQSKTVEYSGRV